MTNRIDGHKITCVDGQAGPVTYSITGPPELVHTIQVFIKKFSRAYANTKFITGGSN